MAKVKFNIDKTNYYDEVSIYINGKIINIDNSIVLDEGVHDIKVEQMHFFNTKWIFLTLPLVLVSSFMSGERELIRMKDKFAYLNFKLDVESDIKLDIFLERKKCIL